MKKRGMMITAISAATAMLVSTAAPVLADAYTIANTPKCIGISHDYRRFYTKPTKDQIYNTCVSKNIGHNACQYYPRNKMRKICDGLNCFHKILVFHLI